ncbi:MAG TPA: hypothetical protein VMU69_23940 [Bradyrhizobium sp.]|nr:hypothetical protein [Bradyrhizobium sp.]
MQIPAFDRNPLRRVGCIVLLTTATVAGSFAFACATPFPALAAFAALHMNRRDAFILTGIIWIMNQVVGYGFLHYPQTWDSFAWGVAIGVAAVVATGIAARTKWTLRSLARPLIILGSFAAAFIGYEVVLYTATVVLPSEPSAFSPAVVGYILEVNAIAFAGLVALQYASVRIGLALPRQSVGPTATAA